MGGILSFREKMLTILILVLTVLSSYLALLVANISVLNEIANSPAKSAMTALEHAKQHLDTAFVCPMHAEIISNDSTATCPLCGMDLVALNLEDSATVTLPANVINVLGIRTARVKRRTLYQFIDTVGYIQYNESLSRIISTQFDSRIENLSISSVGDQIKQGQLLFELYSPRLIKQQQKYVSILKTFGDNETVKLASKENLLLMGFTEAQVLSLRTDSDVKQLVPIYAPQNGVITMLNARNGKFIPAKQDILSLTDLSSVWLMVDIFEHQASWVAIGQRVEALLPFMPDKIFEGRVSYIYPSLNATTHSLKVRLRFDNPDEQLKPNMYASIKIYTSHKKNIITIPTEALIYAGNERRVVLSLGEGEFYPVIVQVGIKTDNHIEIIHGLSEGDNVVISSQFLIDSESAVRASLLRMSRKFPVPTDAQGMVK